MAVLFGSLFKKMTPEETFQKGVEYYKAANYNKAFDCYQTASDKGHAHAQFMLAQLYRNGEGVEQSLSNYVSALIRAAGGGDIDAQYELAGLYETGDVIDKDKAEAFRWYRSAAAACFPPAQYKLATLYEAGSGTEKDMEEAIAWYREAAQQGHAEAQYDLAKKYFSGIFFSTPIPLKYSRSDFLVREVSKSRRLLCTVYPGYVLLFWRSCGLRL